MGLIKNDFWKRRTKHGRNKLFKTPEILWEACCEYFQEIEDNPLTTIDVVKFQGDAKDHHVEKPRAMTIGGLIVFLDIALETWKLYRKRDDFMSVCAKVEQIIYNQKFEGAAADLFNVQIIARELGLKERAVNEVLDKTPGYKKLTDEELEAKLKDLGVDINDL